MLLLLVKFYHSMVNKVLCVFSDVPGRQTHLTVSWCCGEMKLSRSVTIVSGALLSRETTVTQSMLVLLSPSPAHESLLQALLNTRTMRTPDCCSIAEDATSMRLFSALLRKYRESVFCTASSTSSCWDCALRRWRRPDDDIPSLLETGWILSIYTQQSVSVNTELSHTVTHRLNATCASLMQEILCKC